MPRKGDYVPWESRNCIALKDLENNDLGGSIDWVDEERPETIDDITEWDDMLWGAQKEGGARPRNLICGRAHREEAILVQLKGKLSAEGACGNKCAHGDGIFKSCRVTGIHRGACGNCIWQSKGMECVHALPALEEEANLKKRLVEAKQTLLDTKNAINSSKRTLKTIEKEKAARREADDEFSSPKPAACAPDAKKRRGGGSGGGGGGGGGRK